MLSSGCETSGESAALALPSVALSGTVGMNE